MKDMDGVPYGDCINCAESVAPVIVKQFVHSGSQSFPRLGLGRCAAELNDEQSHPPYLFGPQWGRP